MTPAKAFFDPVEYQLIVRLKGVDAATVVGEINRDTTSLPIARAFLSGAREIGFGSIAPLRGNNHSGDALLVQAAVAARAAVFLRENPQVADVKIIGVDPLTQKKLEQMARSNAALEKRQRQPLQEKWY